LGLPTQSLIESFGTLLVVLLEEEEEGIIIAGDVVKVEGDGPTTPGSLKGDRSRRYVRDFQ